MTLMKQFLRTLMLLGTLAPLTASASGPPGPVEINGQMLTLVSRDPPGMRCNNNIKPVK